MNALDTVFLLHMVQAMYAYEASLTNETRLLRDPEMHDFYAAFCGGTI